MRIWILLTLVSAEIYASPRGPWHVPDLPPDATTSQYQLWRRSSRAVLQFNNDGLDPIVAAGERNLNWLVFMNSQRQKPISITDPSVLAGSGIPIDKPSEYNPTLLLEKFSVIKNECPEPLKAIIFSKSPFPKEPPVPMEDYIAFSRKLDKAYQTANRWRLMQPYLDELAQNRANDVRGYYFLSRMSDRADKLAKYGQLNGDERAQIYDWLIQVCQNDSSSTQSSCRGELDGAVSRNDNLESYFQKYFSQARDLWNSYFQIPITAVRHDFSWQRQASGMRNLTTPFLDPGVENVRSFIQINNQEEWRSETFQLLLPFTSDALTKVVFVAGSTPHVNGLGGDTITMDENQPLTEYDAQWTIRHEYGHVLGFPDCYVEFYIRERNVIMNYQLDTKNIMCSRAGHVKEENITELERAYGHTM